MYMNHQMQVFSVKCIFMMTFVNLANFFIYNHQKYSLRQGCRMEFLSLFFNLFVFFFLKKSYHSNLVIKFYVDYEWPNGFQHQIDQAVNCPFWLSDDQWRHVQWRNGPLHNCKNSRISASISEKGMNLKMPKMLRNSSLVSNLWNRQPFLNIFIPQLILEKVF